MELVGVVEADLIYSNFPRSRGNELHHESMISRLPITENQDPARDATES